MSGFQKVLIYDGVPKTWTYRQMCLYLYVLGGQPLHCQVWFKIYSNKMARESEKNEISPLKTKKLLLADQILNIWIFILV